MKTWQTLGYLGLLPFFICLMVGVVIKGFESEAQKIFIFYSAIILSFISGSLWTVMDKSAKAKQQIISNIFWLIAFFSLLFSQLIAVMVLSIGYILIFIYERYLITDIGRANEYIILRFRLTTIVVLLHFCAVFLIIVVD